MTVGLPKYDFLYDNNTFPMSSISGLRDINKYTILFSAYANFTVNEVYSPYIKEVPGSVHCHEIIGRFWLKQN